MSNLERVVPQILDLIDLQRWARQGRLLALVASRTLAGDGWAELGAQRLGEVYGEGDEAARWDLELLRRMARDDRVLLRAAVPRRAPLWRIAGEGPAAVLRWRHVPWRAARGDVVEALAVAWRAVPVAPWAVIPGQTVAPWAVGGCSGAITGELTRENMAQQPPTAPRQPPTAPRSPRKGPGQDFVNGFTTAYGATVGATVAGAPTSLSLRFKPLSLSGGQDAGREGGESSQAQAGGAGQTGGKLSADEAELLAALQACGHVLWGAPRAELLHLARSEPGAARELCAYVQGADLRRVRTAVQVVGALRDWWEANGRKAAERREAVARAREAAERADGSDLGGLAGREPAAGEAQPTAGPGLAPVISLGREALARSRRPAEV